MAAVIHRVLFLSFCSSSVILGDPGAVSRAELKDATKVFKHGRKSPWVLTLTGPFPNGQANAGSWLGTKNALYYCAQSANSISWVLFVSSYTTAIDWITACLAHALKKCTQSRNLSVRCMTFADRRLQTADCMRQQDCKLNETKNIVIKVASSSTLPYSEKYM